MSVPRDPVDRLPHRGAARWVTDVLEVGDGGIRCAGRVPHGCTWTDGGRVSSAMLIEFAAQAAAVLEIASAGEDAGEPRGYVVRARDVDFAVGSFPESAHLTVTVRIAGAAPPLATYRFEARADGAAAAAGTIATYVDRG